MAIRHQARERALQFLYTHDYAPKDASFEEVERQFLSLDAAHRRGWDEFARELAMVALDHQNELDAAIGPLLHHWTLDRLPRVERYCLRLALAELRYFPAIPLRVTINEYLDLVRLFSSDEATQYLNAVLDRLSQDFPQKDFHVSEEGEALAAPRAVPAPVAEKLKTPPPAPATPRSRPRPRIHPEKKPGSERS